MADLYSVAHEAVLFAASMVLLFLLALVLRNPFRPRWLHSDEVAFLAAFFVTTSLSVTFSLLTVRLVDAGMYYLTAGGLSLAFALVLPVVLWRLLGMRARLDACDNGRSPFALSGRRPAGPTNPDALSPT